MEKIGRYKLGKTLGEGGMAVVYAATDSHLERTVAVKVIRPEYASTPQYRALFLKEAKTLAKLSDKAVVPIYDIGEENGILYLVMPLMEGGSLRERLDNYGRFTFTEALTFATRLASSLDHFHGQGIIHRDLKPGNILYDRHGDPYIADFGIAKMQVRSGYTFTLALTPGYASPEQFRGTEITYASDLYAFASILFEVLTGRTPFEAESAEAWMYQHLSQPVPDIRKHRPDLPAGVTAIFAKALAKEPSARYPSVGAFVSALAGTSPQPFVPATPSRAPLGRRNSLPTRRWVNWQRWVAPLLIGGVALMLAIVAWSNIFQPGTSPDPDSVALAPTATNTIENESTVTTAPMPTQTRASTNTPSLPEPTTTLAPLPTLPEPNLETGGVFATSTALIEVEPTETPTIAPSDTSNPPTSTSIPPTPIPPTNTVVPPTNTRVPPTNIVVSPTKTPVPSPTMQAPQTNRTPLRTTSGEVPFGEIRYSPLVITNPPQNAQIFPSRYDPPKLTVSIVPVVTLNERDHLYCFHRQVGATLWFQHWGCHAIQLDSEGAYEVVPLMINSDTDAIVSEMGNPLIVYAEFP